MKRPCQMSWAEYKSFEFDRHVKKYFTREKTIINKKMQPKNKHREYSEEARNEMKRKVRKDMLINWLTELMNKFNYKFKHKQAIANVLRSAQEYFLEHATEQE